MFFTKRKAIILIIICSIFFILTYNDVRSEEIKEISGNAQIIDGDTIKINSKNRRRNTSILIQHKNKNIIIDAGKTFYDSSLNFFPKNNVTSIDGLIITHALADAIGGLDDLRDWTNNTQKNIQVY